MTPDSILAAYRRTLDQVGEQIRIRRYTGSGTNRPWFDVEVQARVMDFDPDELVGTIVQGDRKIIVLADDLTAAQVPDKIRKGDKAIVRGATLNIEAVDNNTRRVAGVLIAYQLQVRG